MALQRTLVHRAEYSEIMMIEPTSKTKDVRDMLIKQGFIKLDTPEEAWRFFIYSSESSRFSDAILAITFENIINVSELLGPGGQLYLTNIEKGRRPDLMGLGADWFFDRLVGCRVVLNDEDQSAVAANRGKFQPMMISNVRATNESLDVFFHYVVVCERDSVVKFSVSSWGAAGFGYSIIPEKGSNIVGGVYVVMGDTPNQTRQSTIRRYQDGAQQIVIRGQDSMDIPSAQSIEYMRVSVKTWRITSYKKDGKTYSSNALPPSISGLRQAEDEFSTKAAAGISSHDLAKAVIVPGETITPGIPQPGDQSSQQFGLISDVKDDWASNKFLGDIMIHFFVFKTKADADLVVGQINSPNPVLWA